MRVSGMVLLVAAWSGAASADEIEVEVASAAIERVDLTGGGYSSAPVLKIVLRIHNKSRTRSVRYRGWALRESDVTGQFRAHLRDELGQSFPPVIFASARPIGQLQDPRLEPGSSVQEVLVFEVPASDARILRLTLSGRMIESRADFHIDFLNPARKTESVAEEPSSPELVEAEPVIVEPPVTETAPKTEAPVKVEERREKTADHAGDLTRVMLLFILLGSCAYFVPMVVAACRSHHQIGPIIVVNLFLGWTFIGWVIALAMAVSQVRRPRLGRRA